MSENKCCAYPIDEDLFGFRDMLEQLPTPSFVTNEEGVYLYVNRAFIDFFEPDTGENKIKSLEAYVGSHYAKIALDQNKKLLITNENVQYDLVVKDNNGDLKDVVINKTILKNSRCNGFLGTVTDVTELKALQRYQQTMFNFSQMLLRINQSITASENIQQLLEVILNEIKEIFENQSCGCILVNYDGILKMDAQFGYTAEAVENFSLNVKDSYYWRYAKHDLDRVYRINQIDLITMEDYTKVAKSENDEEMLSSLSAPIWIDGQLFGLINFDSPKRDGYTQEQADFMEYVSKQLAIAIKNMQLYQQTIHMSHSDSLTGLNNRHHFEDQIYTVIEKCIRENLPLHLVAVDADYLKNINDTFGHLCGDKLLIDIGDTLTKACGENALVSRFGGDEFLAAVYDMDLEVLKARIIEARLQLEKIVYGTYPSSFSFGIASSSSIRCDYMDLLKEADDAMYQEKRSRIGDRRKHD